MPSSTSEDIKLMYETGIMSHDMAHFELVRDHNMVPNEAASFLEGKGIWLSLHDEGDRLFQRMSWMKFMVRKLF